MGRAFMIAVMTRCAVMLAVMSGFLLTVSGQEQVTAAAPCTDPTCTESNTPPPQTCANCVYPPFDQTKCYQNPDPNAQYPACCNPQIICQGETGFDTTQILGMVNAAANVGSVLQGAGSVIASLKQPAGNPASVKPAGNPAPAKPAGNTAPANQAIKPAAAQPLGNAAPAKPAGNTAPANSVFKPAVLQPLGNAAPANSVFKPAVLQPLGHAAPSFSAAKPLGNQAPSFPALKPAGNPAPAKPIAAPKPAIKPIKG
ncbi:transcriptional regulatory protein AlgP-like [Physella acuta]|uniref:transcriptional regulatory protein AlgP-like n=1 Tax=Physella acuta TaxID=109671 RepID=UPI0027DD22B7|nr:transcriptional regulatory protein AlgP-like [Physella acuta]